MNAFPAMIKLMRPKHYVKNLFIFTPLFFAGKLNDLPLLICTFLAFIAFSLCASGVYILNDIIDSAEDRLHPLKKHRPIASGAIKKQPALILMSILFFCGLLILFFISISALIAVCIYITLNIAYSFKLKQIIIIDVVIIAIGFVIRLFVGSFATATPLSVWIIVMTFLLALFIALGKRRDDVLIFEKTGKKMRQVIGGYNLKTLDSAMIIMSVLVVITYILYTTSSGVVSRLHNPNLYLTVIFVIVGIMRYLQIVFVEKNSGSPTRIVLTDRFIQATLVLWLLSFAWILYR